MALNLILRCKFSQNLPTNDSLQKDQLKLQVPENCILPGFFKILPPRRHSLGQRELKGCGILSFSPSLYMVLMQNTNTMFNTCNNYIIIIYTSQYSKLLQYIPHLYQSSITSAKGLSVSYPTASFDIRRVRNRITLLHELRGCLVSLALLDRNMAPPAVKIGGEDVATLRRCLSMLCT